MFKFILHLLVNQNKMHDSTLDLFCEHQEQQDADEFATYVEELASTYEVTCDYIIQEFILD
jgi:hypothetical protein